MPDDAAPIILASTSPRRRELVTLLDLPFHFISADVDESSRDDESPDALVQRLSRAKAQGAPRADAIIVAADTIVALDYAILGKPRDAGDAARMLQLLRARPHLVYSGLTVARGAREITQIAMTTVWMRYYSDAEIAAYVATGDPLDKAAAYAIQHVAFRPVARIEGCQANVMGLPLCHLYRALKSFGVAIAEPDRACQAHLGIACLVAREILSQSGNQKSGDRLLVAEY